MRVLKEDEMRWVSGGLDSCQEHPGEDCDGTHDDWEYDWVDFFDIENFDSNSGMDHEFDGDSHKYTFNFDGFENGAWSESGSIGGIDMDFYARDNGEWGVRGSVDGNDFDFAAQLEHDGGKITFTIPLP